MSSSPKKDKAANVAHAAVNGDQSIDEMNYNSDYKDLSDANSLCEELMKTIDTKN